MSKRNRSCPCGSGRMHRNCCLGRAASPINQSDIQIHLNRLLDKYTTEVVTALDQANFNVQSKLAQDEIALQLRSKLSADTAQNLRYQAAIVERCCEIATTLANECFRKVGHSRHYWFILVRGLAPTILRTLLPTLLAKLDDQVTSVKAVPAVAEILCVLTGIILSSTTENISGVSIKTLGMRGLDFSSTKRAELSALGSVIGYATQIQQYQTTYRFIGKGMSLSDLVNNRSEASDTNRKGIQIYEERRTKYSTVTGFSGVWFDPVTLSTRRSASTEWMMLRMDFFKGFQIQVEGSPGTLRTPWLVEDFWEDRLLPDRLPTATSTPHIFRKVNGDAISGLPLKSMLSAIPDEFFRSYTRDELSDSMFAIYLLLRSRLCTSAIGNSGKSADGIQMISRSAINSLESFRNSWSDVASLGILQATQGEWENELWEVLSQVWAYEKYQPSMSQERLKELIDLFTYKPHSSRWSNDPFLFVKLTPEIVALDLLRLGDFLIDVLISFNHLGRDPELKLGDPTGPLFESGTQSYLLRSLGIDRSSAVVSRELKIGKQRREVDLAFVCDRCLMVLDCKNKPHDGEYMRGSHSRIRNHLSDYRAEFKKNLQRIKMIEDGAAFEAIPPSSFDRAESFICTPTVEYLPISDKAFWINGHAKVGPPEELLATILFLTGRAEF